MASLKPMRWGHAATAAFSVGRKRRDYRRISGLILLLTATLAFSQTTPIQINVDASEAQRRLIHATMQFPVKPGPMSLLYPKWIPGEHGPTGPIEDLAGIKITANGQTIPWRRDDVDVYEFHIDVPQGVSTLDVALDFISPPETGGFSSGASTTSQLAVLSWNQFLLYPKGCPDRSAPVQGHAEGSRRLALWNSTPHRSRIRQRNRVQSIVADHPDRFSRADRR